MKTAMNGDVVTLTIENRSDLRDIIDALVRSVRQMNMETAVAGPCNKPECTECPAFEAQRRNLVRTGQELMEHYNTQSKALATVLAKELLTPVAK